MSFSELQFKKTKVVLAILVAMHGNLSLAQDVTDSSAIAESVLQQDAESNNITWPLLSGESVNSLARSFYPKNKKMQRLFVFKTLQLSREIHPHLRSNSVSNQASLIIIPNIKTLAKHSGKIKSALHKKSSRAKQPQQPNLHMSYGLKDADQFALTPKMQADYEDLVKRNAQLKLELEKLNAKLAHLQQVMVALDVEARRIHSLPAPVPTSVTLPDVPKVLVPEIITPNPVASNKPAASKPIAVVTTAKEPNATTNVNAVKNVALTKPISPETLTTSLSSYLKMALVPLALMLATSGAFILYRRRQSIVNKLNNFEMGGLIERLKRKPAKTKSLSEMLAAPANHVDFSLSDSEFSGSISDVNLDAIMALGNKEEGELALEQARIYVNINRGREATMLLKSQIQAAPKESLHHWLYLLDIYRDTNQKEEFWQYANKLHETFNVIAPRWDLSTPLDLVAPTSLEEFPHIIENLTQLWGACEESAGKCAELKAYIDTLLTDNRNHERTGFSVEVLEEIMLLSDVLDVRAKLANID
ncbi:MAG: hypothetical protein ABL920_00955 [Methylotenera sp.]